MPSPIPPTLSPFVKPPAPGSLAVITSVLNATSNWLLLRYIYAALRPEKHDGQDGEDPEKTKEELKVILISFLRPFEIWKEMAKKIVR
jgi:elongator complex protein 6